MYSNMKASKAVIGLQQITSHGSLIEITNYKNNENIEITFLETGYKKTISWRTFQKNKNIVSPYCKTVYGVGYLGEGEYPTFINSKKTKCYMTWTDMIRRCYVIEENKHVTYRDCEVCEEWHNYQTFAQWYDENYYEVGNELMMLDKDILVKGNKIYSPETCIYVPSRINNLFTKTNAKRGNLPIGVGIHQGKYKAHMSKLVDGKKQMRYYGNYNTPEEAFECYKQIKEEYIKEVADEYSGQIPDDLYFALYSYEVDIND